MLADFETEWGEPWALCSVPRQVVLPSLGSPIPARAASPDFSLILPKPATLTPGRP